MITLVTNKTGTLHACSPHGRSHTFCRRLIDLDDPIKQWRVVGETEVLAAITCPTCHAKAVLREEITVDVRTTWRYAEQGEANEYVIFTDDKQWVISLRQNGEMLLDQQREICRQLAAAPDTVRVLRDLVAHVGEVIGDADLDAPPAYRDAVALLAVLDGTADDVYRRPVSVLRS